MPVSQLYEARIVLSNTQIKALPTTAVELIPALPGKVIYPVFAALHLADWVADYVTVHADAILTIGINGTNATTLVQLNNAVATSVAALLAGGGPDGTWAFLGSRSLVSAPTLYGLANYYDSDLVNTNVAIAVNNQGGGDFTGGDDSTTLVVDVHYTTIDV